MRVVSAWIRSRKGIAVVSHRITKAIAFHVAGNLPDLEQNFESRHRPVPVSLRKPSPEELPHENCGARRPRRLVREAKANRSPDRFGAVYRSRPQLSWSSVTVGLIARLIRGSRSRRSWHSLFSAGRQALTTCTTSAWSRRGRLQKKSAASLTAVRAAEDGLVHVRTTLPNRIGLDILVAYVFRCQGHRSRRKQHKAPMRFPPAWSIHSQSGLMRSYEIESCKRVEGPARLF